MLHLEPITSIHQARALVQAHFVSSVEGNKLVLSDCLTAHCINTVKFEVITGAVHYPYRARFGDAFARSFTVDGCEYVNNGSSDCYYLVATPYHEIEEEIARIKNQRDTPTPVPEAAQPTEATWQAVTCYSQLEGVAPERLRVARDYEEETAGSSVWSGAMRELLMKGRCNVHEISLKLPYVYIKLVGSDVMYGYHYRDLDILNEGAAAPAPVKTKKWVRAEEAGVEYTVGMKVKAKQKGANPFGNVNAVEGKVGCIVAVHDDSVIVTFGEPYTYVNLPFTQVRVKK